MRWVLESGGGGYRMGSAGVGRDGWVGTSKGTRCGGYTRADMRARRKYLHISHKYRRTDGAPLESSSVPGVQM